jgi:hypothetical protein
MGLKWQEQQCEEGSRVDAEATTDANRETSRELRTDASGICSLVLRSIMVVMCISRSLNCGLIAMSWTVPRRDFKAKGEINRDCEQEQLD